ncbi:SIR2 family NAD-dependent protein deacylase [Lysinibacillus xylanilyticus]|uniref:SIR2 family NAD-dependent protein deacylase n=1 Tax=Lysinibacillus xylanilyticus TaxID=582475 RepID=UPI00382BBA08
MSFERLVEKLRDNDVVLWVGAGFSLYAGMPSANTLRDLIINNCTEEEKGYFENQSLSEVASTFVDMRNGSRNELHKILQSAIDIEPKSINAHQLIADIPQINLIVTTNYDKLFEEAYGRDISPIITDSQLPLATKRTQLYKIHGDINVPESIVLTSTDYTNFFRNQNKPLWNKIKTLLAEKTIIFLGYSLSDQNIDFLFENVINDIGSFQKEPYLVAPNLPKHILNRLSQKRINYIDMTGEKFTEKIYEEVKKNS